jgi:hypothetical protein
MISSPAGSSANKPGGPYQKPRADVFTVLLVLALIAILLGIVFLWLENELYDWDFKGGSTVSADQSFVPALADCEGPGDRDQGPVAGSPLTACLFHIPRLSPLTPNP